MNTTSTKGLGGLDDPKSAHFEKKSKDEKGKSESSTLKPVSPEDSKAANVEEAKDDVELIEELEKRVE